MSQTLDALPQDLPDSFLCCYVNSSPRIQIARITNVPNWYFERVVFPGQRLVFESLPEALLEIHCGMMASAILSDTIPCENLRVLEDENLSFNLEEQQRLEELNEGKALTGSAAEVVAAS
jgi:hypothetical protein